MSTLSATETVDSRIISAYNEFGFHMLSHLINQDADQNVFMSSFSIALALAMTYNGAEGTTKEVMAETLKLTGLGLTVVNAVNAALLLRQGRLDPKVQLAIANSIWVRTGTRLASDFIQRIRSSYASETINLDFREPSAAGVINAWVADKTHGKITDLVTSPMVVAAIMILVNAIYFKGLWSQPFDAAKTKEGPFTLLNGSRKLHPMMSQSGKYNYYANDKFQAVSLPYGKGHLSMYIFVPKRSSSISEFQTSLNADNWRNWLSNFREMEGDIVLPRFKVEYAVELEGTLTALGMGVAFGASANFEGMGAGHLEITDVVHKTFVEVNEEGTEAAAAIGVVLARGLPPEPPERFELIVDRPFFTAILDNDIGAVLLMGFIVEPN